MGSGMLKSDRMVSTVRTWHHGDHAIPEGLTPEQVRERVWNWEPETGAVQVWFRDHWVDAAEFRGIVRNDNEAVLGIVGKDYQVALNRLFAQFAEALAKQNGGIKVEVAGSLLGGKRVFMTCKLLSEVVLANGDRVLDYLIFTNDHTGKGALRAYFCRIRVVCMNTLRASESLVGAGGFWFRHDTNLMDKVEEARKILGLAHKVAEASHEETRALASCKLDSQAVNRYFLDVYEQTFGAGPSLAPPADTPEDQVRDVLQALNAKASEYLDRRETILDVWTENHDADIARGTAWGALNAVTEYHDHQRGRGEIREREMTSARFHSNLFGASHADKQVALREALALVR